VYFCERFSVSLRVKPVLGTRTFHFFSLSFIFSREVCCGRRFSDGDVIRSEVFGLDVLYSFGIVVVERTEIAAKEVESL